MIRRLVAAGLLLLGGCVARPAPLAGPIPPAPPVEVQVIGLNDFHGNLETPAAAPTVRLADGGTLKAPLGGAAAIAATARRLRAPLSITVSAGDLIGASPLVSAYFLDEPTIQTMNAIGLDLNAVGNHEFDKGSAELLRMQRGGCAKHTSREPCRVEPFGGARFGFLAANVFQADRRTTILPGTALRQFGPVRIGFIGMTLKETATLVTPAGVAGLSFGDEAATANALVPKLKAAGADTVVLLIHQGARTPDVFRQSGCDGLAGPVLDIIDRLDPAVELVVSGHTHNAYACELQRGGAGRLLTSAGRYGYLLTDIRLTFDPSTRRLIGKSAVNVPVLPANGTDAGVAAIVRKYAAAAAPAAARVVGRVRGDLPSDEDDGESPAANLVADAQLAATRAVGRGDSDLSFVNATGIRAGIAPAADGSVTYGQIFAMQPFGNNLVVKTLTGALLKALLEQQFKDVGGKPELGVLLVPSANFRFAYDLSRPAGQRIVAMTLDGRPIDPQRRYRVTVNNFLASGGDGFTILNQGSDPFDAGLDLDALEAWLATNPAAPPVGRVRKVAQR